MTRKKESAAGIHLLGINGTLAGGGRSIRVVVFKDRLAAPTPSLPHLEVLSQVHHRFLSTPLGIEPTTAGMILKALEDAPPDELAGEPLVWPPQSVRGDRPYAVEAGVALIPIEGVLVHTATFWFGETEYRGIADAVRQAIFDPEVRALALLFASPGGEISGLFELAEEIYTLRGEKPMVAIVDDFAYSAAYAIASSADKILCPRFGGVGSIGAVAMHIDLSEALEQAGVRVQLIQFGSRKTDYSPLKPLSASARDRLQSDIDVIGETFVELVARNRGMSTSKVRETEAGIFMGEAGVQLGFADEIATGEEALAALMAAIA